MIFLTNDHVQQVLDMKTCIEAMENAYRELNESSRTRSRGRRSARSGSGSTIRLDPLTARRLRNRLAGLERSKLDTHLDALAHIERRLQATAIPRMCSPVAPPGSGRALNRPASVTGRGGAESRA